MDETARTVVVVGVLPLNEIAPAVMQWETVAP